MCSARFRARISPAATFVILIISRTVRDPLLPDAFLARQIGATQRDATRRDATPSLARHACVPSAKLLHCPDQLNYVTFGRNCVCQVETRQIERTLLDGVGQSGVFDNATLFAAGTVNCRLIATRDLIAGGCLLQRFQKTTIPVLPSAKRVRFYIMRYPLRCDSRTRRLRCKSLLYTRVTSKLIVTNSLKFDRYSR